MDQTGQKPTGSEETDSVDVVTIPGIHRRFLDTFFSPAKMTAYLTAEPRWVTALFLRCSADWSAGEPDSIRNLGELAAAAIAGPRREPISDAGMAYGIVGYPNRNTSSVFRVSFCSGWSRAPLGHLRFHLGRRRQLPTIPCGYRPCALHSGACRAAYHPPSDSDSRPSVNPKPWEFLLVSSLRVLAWGTYSHGLNSDMVVTSDCSRRPQHRQEAKLQECRGDPLGHDVRHGAPRRALHAHLSTNV